MGPRKNSSRKHKPSKNLRNDLGVVWDADNTLWGWTRMHIAGMGVMSEEIANHTDLEVPSVKESMKNVYSAAGTFDHKPLVQNLQAIDPWLRSHLGMEEIIPDSMDFIISFIIQNQELVKEAEQNREVIAEKLGACLPGKLEGLKDKINVEKLKKEYGDLLMSVHNVYTNSRRHNFELFPGVERLLRDLTRHKVRQIIVSDAPISRVIRRLKFFKIDKHIESIYARQDPSEEKQEASDLEGYEMARRRGGYYDIDVNMVTALKGQRKPNIKLAELFTATDKFPAMDEQTVSQCVAVMGDNFKKDMGLALRNGCMGLFAEYGKPNDEEVEKLYEYGEKAVVDRNADTKPDVETAEIIKNMRDKLVYVTNASGRLMEQLTESEASKRKPKSLLEIVLAMKKAA